MRREHHRDEHVRRKAEQRARLAHAAQVHEHEQENRADAERHLVGGQRRIRGRDRGHPARDRDGYGEDVVGEQRCGRNEPRAHAEIVLGDRERAAASRIREDRLPVREPDEHQQRDDDHGDRKDVRRRDDAREHGEHEEDLLGRVRHRGDGVGGEHGERCRLAQLLVLESFGRERSADEQPLGSHEGGGHKGFV